ncbi:hypothetical protein B7P43_G13371 [Cryptotermes secundus]|uniref:DUF4817 domain-containing protein n=1 Tax=Cryptotermes secundus TaxID=105785 RepID=A0A2J7QSZ2_9NEOP|nr:hypothetical protein B7P43_G13371 [Cryptotermes secundus]
MHVSQTSFVGNIRILQFLNNSTITRIINRFRECGSVSDRKRSERQAILTEAKLADVEKMLQRSLSKSLIRLSAQSGISYRSAQKAMKLHLRAYHVRCVKEMKDLGKEKRLVYCRWFRAFVGNHGTEEFDQVFFTDEVWFHLSGYVNSQNNRSWSSENPRVLHEWPSHYQKIGEWCAVSRRRIVGPISFETTVNSPVYQDIITQFIALLEVDEREGRLQQHGATCLTSNETMQFLCEIFGDRLISKGLWPPRSPDLSPADFLLWGYLKGIVSKIRIHWMTSRGTFRRRLTASVYRCSTG